MTNAITTLGYDLDYREGFAGGCYVQGEPVCVYREEPQCDEETWATAHWLRANGGHPLRSCSGSLENVVIGRCGASGKCANLAERCEDEASFIEQDSTCTVTQDLRDYSPVVYGKCGDRCVWSVSDCLPEESYVKSTPECTADVVEIGACWAGTAWCAVSAESCNAIGKPYEPFYTHIETQEKVGVNCFLSLVPAQPTTRRPSKKPTQRPTWSPTKENIVLTPAVAPSNINVVAETAPPSYPEPSNLEAKADAYQTSSDLSIGLISGIVVGVAVLVGLLVGMIAYRLGVRTADDKHTRSTRAPMRSVSAKEGLEVEVEDGTSVLEDPDC